MSTITLEYFDRGGRIHYRYYEKVTLSKGYRLYTAYGAVPEEIASQGTDAVRAYVDAEVVRVIGEKKERDRVFDEKRRAVNVAISCEYQDLSLEGRIICKNDDLTVELQIPIHGSEPLAWGNSFAGAMAGHKVWARQGEGELSEEAIRCAKRQLVEIYKRESSPVKNLVRELNEHS